MKTLIRTSLFAMLIFSIAGFLAGPGTSSGTAFGEEAVNTDEMLEKTPEEMPKDYTDEEIDQMLDDLQEIDETADTEGKEESEPPVLSKSDKALVEDIRKNPEKYAERIKEMEWLDAHPWVIWTVLSDFVWIEAHPNFAARIYLNYGFWHRYPKIGYIIVLNRPFFVRYPKITFVVYSYDNWFILHPFCAREVYLNYVVFNRYPRLYDRYYRHHEWIHRHPRIIKAAYGNRDLFRTHPQHLKHVYQYRREAVKHRAIRQPHLKKMHDRWMSNAPRPADRKNVKYDLNRPPVKDRDRGKHQSADRNYRNRNDVKNRDLTRAKGMKSNQDIKNRRVPGGKSDVNRTRAPERNREIQRPPAGDKGGVSNRTTRDRGGASTRGATGPGNRRGGGRK
ncbi:MAG: hypothetical protein JW807_16015 [Spirochaetes bacterium]|nr:hypothetical protein [Spirochaetota bacterium]